jgi:hypothetical protein
LERLTPTYGGKSQKNYRGGKKFLFDPLEGGDVQGRLRVGKDNAKGKYVNNTAAVKCYFRDQRSS